MIYKELLLKKHAAIKNIIMLLIMLAVIIDGLFFGVRKSIEASECFCIEKTLDSGSNSIPLRRSVLIGAAESYIISVAEVREVKTVSEIIKKLEKSSATKRIVILTLIICILMSEGVLFTTVLPSVFPWTDIILSRLRIICYIQRQDGSK